MHYQEHLKALVLQEKFLELPVEKLIELGSTFREPFDMLREWRAKLPHDRVMHMIRVRFRWLTTADAVTQAILSDPEAVEQWQVEMDNGQICLVVQPELEEIADRLTIEKWPDEVLIDALKRCP